MISYRAIMELSHSHVIKTFWHVFKPCFLDIEYTRIVVKNKLNMMCWTSHRVSLLPNSVYIGKGLEWIILKPITRFQEFAIPSMHKEYEW